VRHPVYLLRNTDELRHQDVLVWVFGGGGRVTLHCITSQNGGEVLVVSWRPFRSVAHRNDRVPRIFVLEVNWLELWNLRRDMAACIHALSLVCPQWRLSVLETQSCIPGTSKPNTDLPRISELRTQNIDAVTVTDKPCLEHSHITRHLQRLRYITLQCFWQGRCCWGKLGLRGIDYRNTSNPIFCFATNAV
jgi:hypothetical protein